MSRGHKKDDDNNNSSSAAAATLRYSAAATQAAQGKYEVHVQHHQTRLDTQRMVLTAAASEYKVVTQ
jgi:hypothetical protein